jgi:aspartyl-tRNA(Asn)/glutamyl-tRNA(Gln) amidotransferase subunit C
MATFNKQDLLHIAHLSALTLEESEIDVFTNQIKTILTYVDELQQVTLSHQAESVSNVNVFREDIAVKADSASVLAQAPLKDDNYFTVPKILDEK